MVGPVKHHAADDFNAGAQRNWIGRKPAGRMHGAEDVFLAAHEFNYSVHRLGCPRGTGYHGQGSETGSRS